MSINVRAGVVRFGWEWVVVLVCVWGLVASACASTDGRSDLVPSLVPRAETVRESVEIETLTFPGHLWTPFMPPVEDGVEATVGGTLVLPAGSEPLPAVVLVHGCGGVSSGVTLWAAELEKMGIASLTVDSFTGRGVAGVCVGQGSINLASVITDVYRGWQMLDQDPRIDGARIAVMGFSFGGRTAVWSASIRFRDRYGAGAEFAAHLAFYPVSCYIELADETRVTGAPIRIFHGEADDWTPIDQCRRYVDRMAAAGVDIELLAYADAQHGFDSGTPLQTLSSAVSPRACRFVEVDGEILDADTGEAAGVGSRCVERGVTVGSNSVARQASIQDVQRILQDVFGTTGG